MQHPNIVQIYEVGEHDGRPYFSMEWSRRQPGRRASRAARSPPTRRRDWSRLLARRRAARPLARRRPPRPEAGERVCCKPAALSIRSGIRRSPKITDFGLAKRLDVPAAATATGHIVGTPSYMAPEQAGAGQNTIGPLCDVYGLGAILYELLTGRPPFRAETPLDTLLQVDPRRPAAAVAPARPDAARPGNHLPEVPGEGAAAALRRARKPWPTTCAASSTASPSLARPLSPLGRAARWARRRPAAAALVAVCALALAAVASLRGRGTPLARAGDWRRRARKPNRPSTTPATTSAASNGTWPGRT